MKIFTSNQLEHLIARMAQSLTHKKSSPDELFNRKADLVIIQSRGMAKWINLELAKINNISAHIEFPFIRSFISRVLKTCGYSSEDDLWDRETLTWRIFSTLPKLERNHEIIRKYIQANDARRHQLAEQLASLFDEYMIYRQEWLQSWSQDKKHFFFNAEGKRVGLDSPHEDWQMELWNELCRAEKNSFQEALQKFIQSNQLSAEQLYLPEKISIFGITNMPPVFIRFFEKLSEVCQVDLYYFSPCEAYWGDLKSERKLFKRELEDEIPGLPHALLKSWGLLGRDFLNLLLSETQFDDEPYFDPIHEQSSLATLQVGILEMHEEFESPLENDHSITINSCHNARRELEVLHDYLIKTLRDNPDILPHEIVVMAPQIQDYAPHIKNIFGHPHDFPIDFSISDQEVTASPLVSSFNKILALPKTRLTANDILDILENPDILRRFQLRIEDLPLIREWVESSGIRWGKDAEFRAELELPEFEQNSWQFGFDRLMAGYAFDDELLFMDSLVEPTREGVLLGRFKTAVDKLFNLHDRLKQSQFTIEKWCDFLLGLLEDCFDQNSDNSNEYTVITRSIESLRTSSQQAKIKERIGSDIIIKALSSSFAEQSSSHGFIKKGITFCSLLPMRSIPVKIVCMLGLNEGEYPRINRRSGFDLMSKYWRQGDRTMNLDDRYLFLESLLSARKQFYVSYHGLNEKDNSVIPPSIILDEFIEYLKHVIPGFAVTEHPLQAFSNDYFTGKLESFSQLHYRAALAKLTSREKPLEVPVSNTALDYPKDFFDQQGSTQITLKELSDFFKHPAKSFLKLQLGTTLWQEELCELPDNEPFDKPDNLKQFTIRQDFIHQLLTQPDPEEAKEALLKRCIASGDFRHGIEGREDFQKIFQEASDLSQELLNYQKGNEQTYDIDLQFPELKVRLTGQIDRCFDNQFIPFQSGKNNFKHQFTQSINYLALLQVEPSFELHFFTLDKIDLSPQSRPSQSISRELLSSLIALYLEGVKLPLPLFAGCFNEYLKKRLAKKPLDHEVALNAAQKKWQRGANDSFDMDGDDPINQICFGKDFPTDEASPAFSHIHDIYKRLWHSEAK